MVESDPDLDLPPEWSKHAGEDQPEHVVIEYQWSRAQDTMFIVALLQTSTDADGYRLQLSTITSQSTTTRHDYLVRKYDTRAAALDGTKAFIEHLNSRLCDESIAHEEPTIDTIQATIHTFTSDQLFASIRQLVRRLVR